MVQMQKCSVVQRNIVKKQLFLPSMWIYGLQYEVHFGCFPQVSYIEVLDTANRKSNEPAANRPFLPVERPFWIPFFEMVIMGCSGCKLECVRPLRIP